MSDIACVDLKRVSILKQRSLVSSIETCKEYKRELKNKYFLYFSVSYFVKATRLSLVFMKMMKMSILYKRNKKVICACPILVTRGGRRGVAVI